MSIDNEGFLSKQIETKFNSIKDQHIEYLNLAYKINRYAQSRKYSYTFESSEYHKLIANCLFMKLLNGYQGCIILLKKMMPYEANALSRTLCEPLYIIKILKDDPNFYKEYVNLSNYQALKIINVATTNKHSIFDGVRKNITEEEIKNLKDRIDGFDHKQFDTIRLAEKAKLKPHYDTMFRITSNEIHSPPSTIMRYAQFNENDLCMKLDWGPTDKDFDRIIISITSVLMWSMDFMNDIFGLPKDTKRDEVYSLWKELDLKTQ